MAVARCEGTADSQLPCEPLRVYRGLLDREDVIIVS